MRRMMWVVAILSLLSIVCVACGGNDEASDVFEPASQNLSSSGSNGPSADQGRAQTNNVDQTISLAANSPGANPQEQSLANRVIIKSANLSLTVEDTPHMISQITILAENMGGWVVSSSVSTRNDRDFGTITVRVPSERFNEALNTIHLDATTIIREDISGQDVTDEFTDLQSRLRNLEAAEAQMQTFLEGAETTDDVLQVYDQLVRLREQIETTEGRINLLSESASYSSITVSVEEPVAETNDEKNDKDGAAWRPGDTFATAVDALLESLQVIGDGLIWLTVYVIPILFVFALVLAPLGYGYVRLIRRPAPSHSGRTAPSHDRDMS